MRITHARFHSSAMGCGLRTARSILVRSTGVQLRLTRTPGSSLTGTIATTGVIALNILSKGLKNAQRIMKELRTFV